MSDSECPTCGRTDFESELGLKMHHAKTHGEKLGVVTVDCANCGVEMEREHSQIEGNEYTYCSQDCVNEHKRERYSGDGNPRSTLETVDCAACGAELQRPKWRRELEDRFFCDYECMGEVRGEAWEGAANPRWSEFETAECEYCGKVYRIKPSEADRTRFCSRGCRDSGVDYTGENNHRWKEYPTEVCENCEREFQVKPSYAKDRRFCSLECKYEVWPPEGEEHPRWAGGSGKLYYGPKWMQRRERAVIRDQARCQYRDCSMTEKEHLEVHGIGLDVHHRTPLKEYKEGDEIDYESANRLTNLVTLCRSCHRLAEPSEKGNRGTSGL